MPLLAAARRPLPRRRPARRQLPRHKRWARTGVALLVPVLLAAALAVPSAASARVRPRSVAAAMLTLLNAQRARHGLVPLHMAPRLVSSALAHTRAMARADRMAHQLPGEATVGARISRTGYRWVAAGENIGWTGERTRRGILALERVMYHETAPDDGHRRNILARAYTQVGIAVVDDPAHHKIWFTQDFGRPA